MERTINLLAEQFNRDLETCLTIISYPDRENPYYVCEYISAALYKSIVHILITNQNQNIMNTSDFYFVSIMPSGRGLFTATISDFEGNKLRATCPAVMYDEFRSDIISKSELIEYVIESNN